MKYAIKIKNNRQYVFLDPEGIQRLSYLTFSNDYTIDEAEYIDYLKKIK